MKMSWKFWQLLGLGCVLSGSLSAGELVGTLAWGERVSMGTLVSGMVSKTPARAGTRVSKGDLLVGLDTRGFQARLNEARAQANSAKALLEEAQREDERAAELYDRTLLSEHERTTATLGLRQAEAAAARANAALTQARLDYERSQLKAPFDGVVLALNASVGQSVVSEYQSLPLVELGDDSRMVLQAQAGLSTAREAAAANVRVEVGGQQVVADAVEIGFEPVNQVQGQPVYAVRVFFKRPAELELRSGEPARVIW